VTDTFGDYDSTDTAADETEIQYEPATTGNSLLDELREASRAELDNIIHLPVKQREGWNLRFNAVISRADINRYQRAGQGKAKKAENADAVKTNAMPILEKCTGIFKGGRGEDQQVHDAEGRPLRLNSNDFLAMQGEPKDAIKALQKFMGDAGVITMGAALLEQAGWTEDLEPLDPTDG